MFNEYKMKKEEKCTTRSAKTEMWKERYWQSWLVLAPPALSGHPPPRRGLLTASLFEVSTCLWHVGLARWKRDGGSVLLEVSTCLWHVGLARSVTEGVCIVSRVVTVLLKPISTNFLHRSILHINSIYLYIELATNWPCHDSKFAGWRAI